MESLSKTGYRGDMLIGLRGWCEVCGQENFVFFAHCRDEKRDHILDFVRHRECEWKGTCEVCYIKGGVTDSVLWHHQMPYAEVDNILYLKEQTTLAPKTEFDKVVADQEKDEREGEAFMARSDELMNWKPKNYTIR